MKRLKVIYILLIIILLSLPLIVTTIDVKFNLKLDAGDNADIPKFDGNVIKFVTLLPAGQFRPSLWPSLSHKSQVFWPRPRSNQ